MVVWFIEGGRGGSRLRRGVRAADREAHLLDEAAVEEVEWGLVCGISHVIYVCTQRPVDAFGAEGGVAMLVQEVLCCPDFVD